MRRKSLTDGRRCHCDETLTGVREERLVEAPAAGRDLRIMRQLFHLPQPSAVRAASFGRERLVAPARRARSQIGRYRRARCQAAHALWMSGSRQAGGMRTPS